MAIVVDFLANVRGLLRGTKDAEQAFDDVASSLDDIARDGSKVGDRLGDEISDGAKDADRSVERLEASFKDMADASRRESSRAGSEISENVKRGTKDAEGGLRDFKDESASTAKESAASFDGSADSIVDAFQEVAANAFVGFGPAGLAAGLAAAAGIGLISAEITAGTERGEELKQKISDLTAELIEAGDEGAPSLQYIVDQLAALATATDSVSLKDLAGTARDSGSDFRDLALATAGNTENLKDLWREGSRRLTQLQMEADALDTTTNAGVRRYSSLEKQIAAQQTYVGYLGQSLDVSRKAAEQDRLYAEAGGPELAAKAQSMEEYASQVEDSLTGAGEAWEKYVTDGIVNLDAYNAAIEAQVAAVQAFEANMVIASATLSEEALNYIRSLGPEAAPLLQAFVDAPLEQQNRTAANWATLGSTAGTNYTTSLEGSIPSEITGPTIRPVVDLDRARRDIELFQNQSYTVGIGVELRPGTAIDR
jgi:hypothetical protein